MFEEIYHNYDWEKIKKGIYGSTGEDFLRSLAKDTFTHDDIIPLFSPAADQYLEEMAAKSLTITRQRFGNTIQLYAPLYVSNVCANSCVYCGFSRSNLIKRITLTPREVEDEARILYDRGFRHILLLTGEDRRAVTPSDLAKIARSIHGRFASVSIEVYPMETDEYRMMAESGIDGLTLYQETYHRETYANVHPAGKKRDISWRLNGPDRGGMAGFRKIGIGALLGLADWRIESFFTAVHAMHLSRTYWRSLIQISFPRLRNAPAGFTVPFPVDDRSLIHMICAMRIIFPDAGLVLSTREPSRIRDGLLPLGITMMSAGSSTGPGGYGHPGLAGDQFPVEDTRTPEEICSLIRSKGLDPVWKDWDRKFIE